MEFGKYRLTHCLRPSDAYMRQYNIATLIQIMAGRLCGTKPLSEPMLPYCQLLQSYYLKQCWLIVNQILD